MVDNKADKVYCVMEYDWEGAFLVSVWATEDLAKVEVDKLNGERKSRYHLASEEGYGVEEWEVGT